MMDDMPGIIMILGMVIGHLIILLAIAASAIGLGRSICCRADSRAADSYPLVSIARQAQTRLLAPN
jgi:hypothetical protein